VLSTSSIAVAFPGAPRRPGEQRHLADDVADIERRDRIRLVGNAHLDLPAVENEERHAEIRLAHQRIAVLHVTGMARERVQHPELGDGELHRQVAPGGLEARRVEYQRAAHQPLAALHRLRERIHATQQRGDAREQVREAHVLRHVVVGAQA